MRAPFLLLTAIGLVSVTAQTIEAELDLIERVHSSNLQDCASRCLHDYVAFKKRKIWEKAYEKLWGQPPPSPGSSGMFGGGGPSREKTRSDEHGLFSGPSRAAGGGRPLSPDEEALLNVPTVGSVLTPAELAVLGVGPNDRLPTPPTLRGDNFFLDPQNAVPPGEARLESEFGDDARSSFSAGAGAGAGGGGATVDRRIPSGPGKLGAKPGMLATCLPKCERDNDALLNLGDRVVRILQVEVEIGYGGCREQTNNAALCEEMWTLGRIKPQKNALQFRREDLTNNLRMLRTNFGRPVNRVRSRLGSVRQAMPKLTPESIVRSVLYGGQGNGNAGAAGRTGSAPAQPLKAPVVPRRR